MQRVQAARIQLSNGKVAYFYGPPILEEGDKGVTVTGVEFYTPRMVAGIQGNPTPPKEEKLKP